MSAETKIEWCDSTFNPWRICTPVGDGCKNCYAATLAKAFGWGEYKQGVPRHRHSDEKWLEVEKWNREPFYECRWCKWRGPESKTVVLHPETYNWKHCPRCDPAESEAVDAQCLAPARRRVFCLSLGDWLDNEVPIEWLVDLLDLIRRTPNLDWLLLTKRIGNFENRLGDAWRYAALPSDDKETPLTAWIADWAQRGKPPENVWIGATVVNQAEADRDVPKLLRAPARIRFLSIEPMLGPIEIEACWFGDYESCAGYYPRQLHWVIGGFESGRNARAGHPAWAVDLRDQCEAFGTAFLWKQNGEFLPVLDYYSDDDEAREAALDCKHILLTRDGYEWVVGDRDGGRHDGQPPSGTWILHRVGKKAAGNVLDGRQHMEFPSCP